MKIKKLSTILLSLLFVVSCIFPLSSCFRIKKEKNGVIYERWDTYDYYYVEGYEGDASEVVIEPTCDGLPVTCIWGGAFADCSSLVSVTIPDSVTSIGLMAFANCSNLVSVSLPNSLVTIEWRAFENCTGLTDITLPDSLVYLGKEVFKGCDGLQFNTYDNGVYLESRQNPYYALVEINEDENIFSYTVHKQTKLITKHIFSERETLTEIIVEEGNEKYQSIDGNLYTKDGKTFIQYASGKTDGEFSLPQGVTTIEDRAFYNSLFLEKLIFPEGVTSVKNDALSGNKNLTEISIPDSIEYFSDCGLYAEGLQYNIYDNAKYIGNENNPYVVLVERTSDDISTCRIHEDTRVIMGGAFAFYLKKGQSFSMVIPKGVIDVGKRICSFDMVVYAEATSQPSGWNSSWAWNGGKFSSIDYYWYREKRSLKFGKYWRYVDGVPKAW